MREQTKTRTMNPIFPSQLSTDRVDKLNHKWMVVVLLLFSVSTLIIPQHRLFYEPIQHLIQQKLIRTPSVQVKCVTPGGARDDHHSISYTDVYCANAFNKAMQGENIPSTLEMIRKNVRSSLKKHAKFLNESVQKYRYINNKTLSDYQELKIHVRHVIAFGTPGALLVYALCLVLPQFVWGLIGEFTDSVNIGQTLENANSQFFRERPQIVGGVGGRVLGVGGSRNSASLLYLGKKLSAMAVAAVLIVYAQSFTGKQIVGLRDDMEAAPQALAHFPDEMNLNSLFQPPNDTFVCAYYKLVSANSNSFESQKVQCAILDTDYVIFGKTDLIQSMIILKELLEFDLIVMTTVITALYCLLVANTVSLIAWVYTLGVAKRRVTYGLDSETPMDLVFLIKMAKINTGMDVVRNLTHSVNEEFKNFKLSLQSPRRVTVTTNESKPPENNGILHLHPPPQHHSNLSDL